MPILPQVRSDAEYLRDLISSLRSDCTNVISNGFLLTGEKLEAVRASNAIELRKLELILETGIIPEKYKSIITKDTYYPSPEELRKKSEPLPTAKYTMFSTKQSRKEPGVTNSNFKVTRSDTSHVTEFFMEHKEEKSYPKGGFAAKVKQGYSSEDSTKPKYAIKIYHKNMFLGNTAHELRLAMRAAHCYVLLGRSGFAFRWNDKQYIVTEWLNGSTLYSADQKDIQSMPIPQRIVMAISLLRELNVLHKQGLIHGDIKPDNVIVDVDNGKLNFVDLDSVRPKNEMPLHGTMPMFTEPYLPNPQMSYDAKHNPSELYLKFDEKTDMYAMGLTLVHLFQEIYILRPKAKEIEVKVNGNSTEYKHIFNTFSLSYGEKYNEYKDTKLQKLLKQMLFQEGIIPVTADKVIKAFQTVLLKEYPDSDEKYHEEAQRVALDSELLAEDGGKAFKEIEKELLGYNQRLEFLRGLRINIKNEPSVELGKSASCSL